MNKENPLAVTSGMLDGVRNGRQVRWYVLSLPPCHRGPASGLREELDRRVREGEPLFDFFAPSYVEVCESHGVLVRTERPLLYNYVFVRASEVELFRLKRRLSQYNFLPRVHDSQGSHYPYLSDGAMANLRWVARSYSDVLPVYVPPPDKLCKGDRVRITEGRFRGVEAEVVIRPGAGRKDVVVCVDNRMWVPLLHVRSGQYEVISLNNASKHVYTRLDNERYSTGLHEALCRHHSPCGVTDADRALASEVLRFYGSLRPDTDILRCKLYALLLPARVVLNQVDECRELLGEARTFLPLVKAEQSRALLLVTLYGCTDSSIYCGEAHALLAPWRRQPSLKKSKLRLLRYLDDYDRVLGHGDHRESRIETENQELKD